MITKLNIIESRIIGVLLEKEITTPEQYPLSLNGLTTGCNQKSNREPVMQLTESEVQEALDELDARRQIIEDQYGSRVAKYKHKFCNTEFGSYKFTPQQTAIVCLLLLRGPQTPGELRSRSGRLADFNNVGEVENALEQLADFNGDGLVLRLAREPGKRESRYMHCFSDLDPQNDINEGAGSQTEVKAFNAGNSTDVYENSAPTDQKATLPNHNGDQDLVSRVKLLEEQVAILTSKLQNLMKQLGE